MSNVMISNKLAPWKHISDTLQLIMHIKLEIQLTFCGLSCPVLCVSGSLLHFSWPIAAPNPFQKWFSGFAIVGIQMVYKNHGISLNEKYLNTLVNDKSYGKILVCLGKKSQVDYLFSKLTLSMNILFIMGDFYKQLHIV